MPEDAKVSCEEVFGPVLTSSPGRRRRRRVRRGQRLAVRAADRGLHPDVQTAFRALAELEVGGVIIGDVPSYRADQMPYGGVKESGVGREGLVPAMTDFTDERVMVLTGLEL